MLDQVLSRHRPLDEALTLPALTALPANDRGLARLLAATALRRHGQIAALESLFLDRPLPDSAARARHLLAIGLVQLLFLQQPPHAAVDTVVGAAKAHRATARFAGLINAVLRRAGREGAALLARQDAARLNTPDWLWQRWTAAYGAETAAAIAKAHLEEAPLDLSLQSPADTDLWADRLAAERLPTGGLRRLAGGAVPELPGFEDGAWWVQDAAAALPAPLLGVGPGDRVVDLCAAPGGKTAQLAAAGAEVVAVDRAAARLDRLRENLRRLRLTAETVTADATAWQPDSPVDAVLVDAPCSATGTIRRHPDIPHLKRPEDLIGLAKTQATILSNAARMLKPGGRLVFCTCSLEPEEGERIAAAALAGDLPLIPDPIGAGEVGGLAEIVKADGTVRTHPGLSFPFGRLDGFHIARFRRK